MQRHLQNMYISQNHLSLRKPIFTPHIDFDPNRCVDQPLFDFLCYLQPSDDEKRWRQRNSRFDQMDVVNFSMYDCIQYPTWYSNVAVSAIRGVISGGC